MTSLRAVISEILQSREFLISDLDGYLIGKRKDVEVVFLLLVDKDETALTTLIFFSIESRSVNSESGNIIARGIPGNPPPVPASSILVPGKKLITFAIDNEWRT